MFNSVDLFTGIGGFTLAFENKCKPLLYCDNNDGVVGTLKGLMKQGKIPHAPVVTDV